MTMFTYTDADGDKLNVQTSGGHKDTAWVRNPGDSAVHVSKADAPAVALAILEAAGWEAKVASTVGAEEAVYALREHVRDTAQEAELAAEALALLNAATDSCYADFPNETVREVWRRAARRAREIHS
ncbi:hypothetical protein HOU52_gp53 [Arthrobacter phage Yang]|uniref:Uncharacterized protein n=1 Tax=Arthrobacter phage Yang TaxID=2419970 RepID=A0A3G2KJH7_9CAUD|nr:hypothetical protein HOU52_gp53 [Arthrobacter phage Yang]AYN59138.1 hypothetical protein PBI_YANG_53 [Arthrobacter phage Yang]